MIRTIIITALFAASVTSSAAFGQNIHPSQSRRPQRPSHPTEQELSDMSAGYGKLADAYRIIARNYLDTMSYDAIVEKGIVSMLAQLDPHSVYLTAKEQQTANEELGGGFSGIGIEFNTLNDTIIVVNTIAGGPAERVGLLPNDRITDIDRESAIGMSRSDVPKHLRGPKGTKVELKVFRRGTGELDFTIVRDDIPITTVDVAYKPDPRTGYIKVNRFGATTGREFAEAFDRLGKGIDGLILDLRGNGGGFLPEAIRMGEFFLSRGQRIVSTEGNMYPSQFYDAKSDGRFTGGRLIVMVDEISASASEIVAGAVQDWDRGIVVGSATFGKGLVQREFSLEDGSAIRLTIARYLTPTGRAIQRPYERGHADDYFRNAAERYALGGRDEDANGDAESDSVAMAAVERFRTLRSGRVVYGGGGVRPDVALVADTTGYSPYWSKLMRSGQLREFVQSYLDVNLRKLSSQYRNIEKYLKEFDAAPLLPGLADYAAAHGTERDDEGLATSREWLSAQIKALIAQRLWDLPGYYRVAHYTFDNEFRSAHRMMLRWYDTPWTDGGPVTDDLVGRVSQ